MKKLLIILTVFFAAASNSFAQKDESAQEGKLKERCLQYVQNRLELTKPEIVKFRPIFFNYFREFAQIHRQYKGDKLVFRQKIIDLRLRYRDEFRQVLDIQKANKVYDFEDEFRKKALEIIKENRRNKINSNTEVYFKNANRSTSFRNTTHFAYS